MDSARFAFLSHTVYMSFMTLSDVLHGVAREITCHEDHIREMSAFLCFMEIRANNTSTSATVARSWYVFFVEYRILKTECSTAHR